MWRNILSCIRSSPRLMSSDRTRWYWSSLINHCNDNMRGQTTTQTLLSSYLFRDFFSFYWRMCQIQQRIHKVFASVFPKFGNQIWFLKRICHFMGEGYKTQCLCWKEMLVTMHHAKQIHLFHPVPLEFKREYFTHTLSKWNRHTISVSTESREQIDNTNWTHGTTKP